MRTKSNLQTMPWPWPSLQIPEAIVQNFLPPSVMLEGPVVTSVDQISWFLHNRETGLEVAAWTLRHTRPHSWITERACGRSRRQSVDS